MIVGITIASMMPSELKQDVGVRQTRRAVRIEKAMRGSRERQRTIQRTRDLAAAQCKIPSVGCLRQRDGDGHGVPRSPSAVHGHCPARSRPANRMNEKNGENANTLAVPQIASAKHEERFTDTPAKGNAAR